MRELNDNIQAFFALLGAGLWEKNVRLSEFKKIDYSKVYQLSEEQSVVGLVTAGLEKIIDNKPPQDMLLVFVGTTLQIEHKNIAMNEFVAKIISYLRIKDVYALLVKGQGIAQCYERPLWRASGDIDLLLSYENYVKAKNILSPLAIDVEKERKSFKHIGITMPEGFIVELHGTLRSRLSARVDKGIDDVQNDVFCGGNVRSWQNKGTTVFLPAPDNDVVFVFTHILHHFYLEGVGLRQICDWCRLLWTYRDSLNYGLLESRLRKMGLMTEWKAFAAVAVDWLGMPAGAMPLYSSDWKWSKKAEMIVAFILETGNFGHNREMANGKVGSAWNKAKDFSRHTRIFPFDSFKFFCHFFVDGIKQVIQ